MTSRIAWSTHGYEVIDGSKRFELGGDSGLHYWFSTLTAFQFRAPSGHILMMRKVITERGAYWCAYKRVNGRVHKKIFPDLREVDLSLLEQMARARSLDHLRTKSPPPRQPFQFGNTLESALCIYGFPTIPDKLALLGRYRALCRQHHPDHGGSHEDMLAVNLAYEYLKAYV
jgi:hypothetical protein